MLCQCSKPWQGAMMILSTTCALLHGRQGLADEVSTNSAELTGKRPNIVLIMSDDMGYSDIGCYGGEIQTPNLDSLASGGLRFTQFYNTGRCCPTRASLLSGLYPHQAGIGWMTADRGHDGYRGDLNRRCVTIAEALRPSGYSTYMVGKWHVTKGTRPEGPKHNWPLQRGFERFYGTVTGAGSFFDPGTLARDNNMISPFNDPEYKPKQYYYTEAISDHAIRFIDEHEKQDSDKPFFMYVAYTAAHWPMHALERDVAKYKGKYDDGYAPIRERRLQRMQKMGLIDPSWKMTQQVGDWQKFEHKEWESRCMEVYAAMIDNMDQGIGRIVKALKRHKKFDNTLILFLQDNGGCQEGVGRGEKMKRPAKPTLPTIAADALRTDVIPRQNRAGVPTLKGPNIMPGPEDTYIAYGINWANVSNTPFREYKHFVHEGGISTPLIAHWPKGIKRHGEFENQPGHLIDLMATCVDVAQANYPKQVDGTPIQSLEGRSLSPAFAGKQIEREAIYWEHEGNRAIRVGKWKLVAKENRPWELYDMKQDRTETRDLVEEMPDKVKQLSKMWDAWAKRANVLPLGTWRAKKKNVKFLKNKKKFHLKAGADLPRTKAPYVEGRGFNVSAELIALGNEGVVVAQGGVTDGWSLYVKNGALVFATRHKGKLSLVATSESLGKDTKTVGIKLAKNGGVELTVNGKTIKEGQVPGPMVRMPLDGLQVGHDTNGAVGQYAAPFPFKGEIDRVQVQLTD